MRSFVGTMDLVNAARELFFFNAAIWFLLAFASLFRMNAATLSPMWVILIAILMFANAILMAIAGFGVASRRRFFLYLGVALLAANILLTFTDQVGLFDLITLLIDLVLLAILFIARDQFGGGRAKFLP